jgi:tetratricopeptide (TPR) repeat protein
VALTILAPALGGSTELWAQAVMILGTGVLFVLFPARRSVGPAMNILFITIGGAALIGFLPAHWFPPSEWRTALSNLGVQLPDTQSPQPWLTLQCSCLFWLGLAWAYYLFAHDWNRSRQTAWDGYCLGILALAAVLVTAYALKWRIPFWPNVREFGFFPNRNQTGNVLGLGGVIIYANAFQHLERGRRRGWLWLGGLGLVCWSLILNYSRAGIILFFVGALTWHLWWLIRTRRTESMVPRAIAWGPLAILFGLLLFAGGETLIRFKQSADLASGAEAGRFLIQRDAFRLFLKSPLLGIGLGNFRSLFSVHHQFFLSESEAIHPESDWLWVATEMGLFAPFLILVGFVLWFWRCLPFNPGTWRGIRTAAMICGIGFAVHGLFDVSGHRIGALWPALFLAATAIHPENVGVMNRMLPVLFRAAGLVFIAIAIWWFGSIVRLTRFPTTATVQDLVNEITIAGNAERYDRLLELSEEGIKEAPLNWLFYYNRGVAEARLYAGRSKISRDFAIARFLMPSWPDLYMKEGFTCLLVGESDLGFDIWKEGTERLSNPGAFYSDIFGLVKDDPDLRDRWRELGAANKAWTLIFLQSATPAEFQIELNRIVGKDPDLGGLTPDQLKRLFELWYEKGEKLSLAETLRAHSEWQEIGWRQLARVYAEFQDYRQAYEIVKRFTPAPAIEIPPNESVNSLASRFRVTNSDGDSLALAAAEAKAGQIDDALAVLTVLESRPHPPPLVYYIEADLFTRKADWAKAWQALWKYTEQAAPRNG